MASIIRRGNNKFRVQVRKNGQKLTKTFTALDTSAKAIQKANDDAIAWGVIQEGQIDAGAKIGINGKIGMTFGEAVSRFIKENKDYCETAYFVLKALGAGLSSIDISKITDDDIVKYIKRKNVAPGSAAVDFSYIRSVLKMAQVGWGYHVPDVVGRARDRLTILKLIGKSRSRDRRPTEQELQLLLNHDYKSKMPMADIIRFAISSAMRQAEITRIKFETITRPANEKEKATVLIKDRKHPTLKHGNDKMVPLLNESLEIIARQKSNDEQEYIFPYNAKSIGTMFSDTCKKLGIEDLHFHDLRHEGVTRLFEMGYRIEEVQLFSGHEDLKTLQRYMHLKPNNVRGLEVEKISELSSVIIGRSEIGSAPSGGIVIGAEEMEQYKQFLEFQAFKKGKAA